MLFQKVQYLGKTRNLPYKGRDAWNKDEPVHIAVGGEAIVSQEKAEQLVSDFPNDFKTIGNPISDEAPEKSKSQRKKVVE